MEQEIIASPRDALDDKNPPTRDQNEGHGDKTAVIRTTAGVDAMLK